MKRQNKLRCLCRGRKKEMAGDQIVLRLILNFNTDVFSLEIKMFMMQMMQMQMMWTFCILHRNKSTFQYWKLQSSDQLPPTGWIFWWWLRESLLANLVEQISHEKGFSPVCKRRWAFSHPLLLKQPPQISHLNFVFFSWHVWWVFNSVLRRKVAGQTEQLCG